MSDNKQNYYTVVSTTIVKAKNMTDAQSVASGRRGVTGKVVGKTTNVSRVTASVAQEILA